jgi:hypothetical protein
MLEIRQFQASDVLGRHADIGISEVVMDRHILA